MAADDDDVMNGVEWDGLIGLVRKKNDAGTSKTVAHLQGRGFLLKQATTDQHKKKRTHNATTRDHQQRK